MFLPALAVWQSTIPKVDVEIGKPIPNVVLTDMAGKSVSLSSFRGKKVILFNWASW